MLKNLILILAMTFVYGNVLAQDKDKIKKKPKVTWTCHLSCPTHGDPAAANPEAHDGDHDSKKESTHVNKVKRQPKGVSACYKTGNSLKETYELLESAVLLAQMSACENCTAAILHKDVECWNSVSGKRLNASLIYEMITKERENTEQHKAQ